MKSTFSSPLANSDRNPSTSHRAVGGQAFVQDFLVHLGLHRWFVWYVLFSLIGSYWLIDHGWRNSLEFTETSEIYQGNRNLTADRLEKINPGSTAARLYLAAIAIIAWVLPAKVKFQVGSPLFAVLAIFMSWLGLSILWSVNPNYTSFKLVVLAVMTFTSLGLARQFSIRELGVIFSMVSIGFIGIGLIAELALGTFQPWGDYRFSGTAHPNTEAIYGAILCLFAPMFLGEQRRWKLISLSVLFVGLICVYMTKSRTSLLAVLVGWSVFHMMRANAKQRTASIVGVIVLGSIAFLFVATFGPAFFDRLMGVATLGREDDVSTLTGRLPLWEIIMDHIESKPILGYGYLAFWDDKRVEYLSSTLSWVIPHSHNMYLDILLDVGIVGMIFFVGAVITSLYHTTGAAWQAEARDRVFVFALIVCALVNGVAESLFKLPGFPLFVVLTMLLRCLWIEPRRNDARSS